MARYRRLTLMEREELSRMLAAGYSLRATGQALSRAPSTLSRELSRHQGPNKGVGPNEGVGSLYQSNHSGNQRPHGELVA